MAFIGWLGNKDRVTLAADGDKRAPDTVALMQLPADTYYEVTETGELYDSEHEAESACWDSCIGENDDDEQVEMVADEPFSTYTEHRVPPFIVTRQAGFYRDYASVNICRDRDYIPPGMLCGTAAYPETIECDTFASACDAAKVLAARWAAAIGEPVEVETDTAEIGGDESTWTALPSGLLFEGGADDLAA